MAKKQRIQKTNKHDKEAPKDPLSKYPLESDNIRSKDKPTGAQTVDSVTNLRMQR